MVVMFSHYLDGEMEWTRDKGSFERVEVPDDLARKYEAATRRWRQLKKQIDAIYNAQSL